ncbi:YybS family protein [Bacillus aquiflavi]|uniref:YybS family protein n=1 Tax=Bacillus aquiflavi TaxID=2672567 RepID=A0A6B3VX88_9BACI|nr:YybS family protein [Bacillus aquiflavi]MBA4537641.1 YybS family protein [Bacillus aquiflavi]NEY81898.1 YybS family protein [Bacillus aquiflavi]UAC48170.1 YybS family protein [Bacillus aquiflavi]
MGNIHKLTEGALFLSIYAVLLLVFLYIPVLGVVVSLFLVFPFILMTVKNELKFSLVFLIAATLISLIVGTILAVPVTITYGTVGMVIGYLLKKENSRFAIYIGGSLALLINIVLQYVVAVSFFQLNFIEETIQVFRESTELSFEMLARMGQSPNEALQKQFEDTIKLMKTLAPSLFVLMAFIGMFVIQLVNMPILRRFHIQPPKWRPFCELTLPRSLLLYYLLTILIILLVKPAEDQFLYGALTNLSFILQALILLQGFAFIFYFSYSKGYSKAIPIIATILAFIIPIFLPIVRILGIIDLGFNLRQYVGTKK